MNERLSGRHTSENILPNEQFFAEETKKLWREYQDEWEDYQSAYDSSARQAQSPAEREDRRKRYKALDQKSTQILRSLETPEQCLAFQSFLAERYTERNTDYCPRGQSLSNLKEVVHNCKNCDPMLESSKNRYASALYDEGRMDYFKIPLRALIATLSSEERTACNIDTEEARVAKIDQKFTKLFDLVPMELFDVVKDCRDSLMKGEEEYDSLCSSYATLALYTAPRDFNKQELLNLAHEGAEYEIVDLSKVQFVDREDLDDGVENETFEYGLINVDLVEDLPDKSTAEWTANSLVMYNSVNRIMHEMHQIYPNLHHDAMEEYSQIVAALSFGLENVERIFHDSFVISASELGVSSKEAVPQPLEDVIWQTLKHYEDVYLTSLRMGWLYSHHDMGSDYDYSRGEDIECEVASLNRKHIESFRNEVIPLLEAKVAEMATQSQK